MQILKRLLIPTSLDATLFITSLLIVIGTISLIVLKHLVGIGDDSTTAIAVVNAIVVTAIGCSIAWGNCRRRRAIGLLVVSLLCVLVPPLWFLFVLGGKAEPNYLENSWWWYEGYDYSKYSNEMAKTLLWIGLGLFCAWMASVVTVLIFRFVPHWITRLVRWAGGKASTRFEMNRTKLLIVVAVCLLVMGIFNNILIANGFNVFRETAGSSWLEIPVMAMLSLVGLGCFVVLPSWCLMRSTTWWAKLIGGAILIAAPAIYGWAQSSYLNPAFVWVQVSVFAAGGLLFAATVFCLRQSTIESEDTTTARHQSLTLWSTPCVLLIVATLTSPWFLDFSLLFSPSLGVPMFSTEMFSIAMESASLQRRTDGQLRGSSTSFYSVRFKPESTNVLASVPAATNGLTVFCFFDFHREVDTSSIKSRSKQSSINGGVMTAQQLEDVMNNTVNFSYWQDFEVDDSKGKATINSSATIFLQCTKRGNIGRLLGAIDKFTNRQQIRIISEIIPADWPAIVKASQSCNIQIEGPLPTTFTVTDQTRQMSLKNIDLALGSYIQYQADGEVFTPGLWKLLKETDIRAQQHGFQRNDQQFWDLTFAMTPRTDVSQLLSGAINFHKTVDKERQYHLAYGFDGDDDKGEITHLYLPAGEGSARLDHLTELRTLSFDINWMIEQSVVSSRVVDSLPDLSTLTKLEELYFSDVTLRARDLKFLQPLKALKHLQMPPIPRMPAGQKQASPELSHPFGYDTIPSLESIDLLGTPDPVAIAEFKKLPNLKKLVITDVLNATAQDANYEANLQKQLPGVEVKLIPFGEYQPQAPVKFQEYLKTKRAEIFDTMINRK